MGKIGDLFVRLGLKKEEFDKGIKQAQDETAGFGKSLQGMKAGALAVWAAVGAAVGKFAGDFIKETQKIGDKWNIAMAGLKASYGQFIATISSGEGWRNLFSNMREASKLAKEAAASLDEVFERKTSFGYLEAETNRKIAEQRQIANNASKSKADREAANREIIRLEQELTDKKIEIWQQEARAYRDTFQARTGLTDEETDIVVRDYNTNRSAILQARAYAEKKAKLQRGYTLGSIANANSMGGYGVNTGSINAELRQLEAETPENIKALAEITKKYDKANDELVGSMATAEVGVINLKTEELNKTLRASNTLGRLAAGGSGDAGDAGTKTEDTAKILQEIADDEEAIAAADAALNEAADQLYEAFREQHITTIPEAMQQIAEVAFKAEMQAVNAMQSQADKMEEEQQRIQEIADGAAQLAEEFKLAMVDGFADGIQSLMDGLTGLSELNMGSVLEALLGPLADLAIKQGKLTMLQGIAIQSIGESLKSLNGGAAIAAGAALIAAGTAAKAGMTALANSMGGGGASSATTAQSSAANSVYSEEIIVKVEGKISGNDILISGSRASKNWSR